MRQFVEVAWDSLSKQGEELCGDYVSLTTTPDSLVVVLSDGLGSGVKANISATLTAHIAGAMFKQGASVEEIMETLVETLPECQVRKLAYATFAILKIDHGREAHLVEYDSPPLILIHAGQIADLPATERTVNGRTIREARFSLQEDDTMVMVSDGYLHAGVGGLYRMGWGWENIAVSVKRWSSTGSDVYELSRALSRTCAKLYQGSPSSGGGVGDDATVVAMRARQPVTATIWTGPPGDKANDAVAVSRLMEADGAKVICGGTTAQIAARVLGQELKVEWIPPAQRLGRPTRKKGTPPTARLAGVDLVTEGILTLAQVVEELEQAETVHDLPPDQDAATRLARILLAADVIHFVIGTALNPNQVADLVRGEPMRMIYVKELVRQLRRRTKEVSVESV